IVLKLVPKRAPEDFRQLLAEVNPVSYQVRRLVIFGRNGSRMDFLLTNVRENYIAPDSKFVFTPRQASLSEEPADVGHASSLPLAFGPHHEAPLAYLVR